VYALEAPWGSKAVHALCSALLPAITPRLEAAVLDVYQSGDKAALTPDVDGNGTTQSLTDAIVSRLG
jgi:isocitrate/isopropylmalate dehydrogenase